MRYEGYYHDGLTAARHPAYVTLGAEALHIHTPEGELLDAWPLAGLRLAEEVYPGQPVRLRHRLRGEAALSFPDTAILDVLKARGVRQLAGSPFLRHGAIAVLVWGVVLVAAVAGALWLFPRLAEPLASLVPTAWEKKLGEQVVGRMAGPQGFCRGGAGQAALAGLARRLSAGARVPFPIRVHVSRDPRVNAFAAPGGQIVLLQGLIGTARRPEEVAGVLAHEIAHSQQRHPMRGLLRAAGLRLLLSAMLGDAGSLQSGAGRLAASLVQLSYTREDELAADRIGVRLLNRADIRGDGLVTLLQRLAPSDSRAAGPAWLSSHPLGAERISLVRRLAHGHGDALSPAEWEAVRTMCR